MDSPRVVIEPAAEAHAPVLQVLASNPAIAAMTTLPDPYPPGGALVWVRQAVDGRRNGTTFAYVIRERAGGIVGVSSLARVSQIHRVGELGYWIGQPFWGHGYATAAGRLVLRAGFEELGLQRVEAGVLDKNPASARVLEKLGFEPTGIRILHEKGSGRTFVLDRQTWLRLPFAGT